MSVSGTRCGEKLLVEEWGGLSSSDSESREGTSPDPVFSPPSFSSSFKVTDTTRAAETVQALRVRREIYDAFKNGQQEALKRDEEALYTKTAIDVFYRRLVEVFFAEDRIDVGSITFQGCPPVSSLCFTAHLRLRDRVTGELKAIDCSTHLGQYVASFANQIFKRNANFELSGMAVLGKEREDVLEEVLRGYFCVLENSEAERNSLALHLTDLVIERLTAIFCEEPVLSRIRERLASRMSLLENAQKAIASVPLEQVRCEAQKYKDDILCRIRVLAEASF